MSELNESRAGLDKIDKRYEAEIAKLRAAHASEEDLQCAYSEWKGERDLQEAEVDELFTGIIRARAKELDVPLPRHGHEDEKEFWYQSPANGRYILTQQGRDYMDDAIWKKEERRHNRRIRWITFGTGLVGALTGLVSVLANNWEKLGKMFSAILQHLHG